MAISHTSVWRIGLNANADLAQWVVLDRALDEAQLRSLRRQLGVRRGSE